MGKPTWRWQETLLLEEIDKSEATVDFLRRAKAREKGWFSETVQHYLDIYLANFGGVCFQHETDSEFAKRRARWPQAKLTPFPAETEVDRDARCMRVRARIESHVKALSPNRASNKPKGTAAPSQKALSLTILPTTKPTLTNGLQEFKKSSHSAKPPMPSRTNGNGDFTAYNAACKEAYDQLPEREDFKRLAQELNQEQLAAQRDVSHGQTREEKAKAFPEWISDICTVIAAEIGWIGWFPIGGLDEHGNIKAIFPHVGSLGGVTFEQWLAKKIGWSVRRLRVEFDNFLQEVFDPVQPGEECMAPDLSPTPSTEPVPSASPPANLTATPSTPQAAPSRSNSSTPCKTPRNDDSSGGALPQTPEPSQETPARKHTPSTPEVTSPVGVVPPIMNTEETLLPCNTPPPAIASPHNESVEAMDDVGDSGGCGSDIDATPEVAQGNDVEASPYHIQSSEVHSPLHNSPTSLSNASTAPAARSGKANASTAQLRRTDGTGADNSQGTASVPYRKELPPRKRTRTAKAQNKSPDMNASKYVRRRVHPASVEEPTDLSAEALAEPAPERGAPTTRGKRKASTDGAPGRKKRRR